MMTHRTKFATLFASLIAMLGVLCVAPKAEAACTAATIEGSYGFRFDGFVGPSSGVAKKVGAFAPEAVVGEISFVVPRTFIRDYICDRKTYQNGSKTEVLDLCRDRQPAYFMFFRPFVECGKTEGHQFSGASVTHAKQLTVFRELMDVFRRARPNVRICFRNRRVERKG